MQCLFSWIACSTFCFFVIYRVKLLINKTDSALESKANTASLENELVELQKSMDKVKKNNGVTVGKWKSRAQKLRMER